MSRHTSQHLFSPAWMCFVRTVWSSTATTIVSTVTSFLVQFFQRDSLMDPFQALSLTPARNTGGMRSQGEGKTNNWGGIFLSLHVGHVDNANQALPGT